MLINDDCITEMDNLIQQGVKVDLIVTDPPYLMNYHTGFRKNKTHRFTKPILNDDNPKLIKDAVKRWFEILKMGGGLYCFCSWHHIDFFKQTIEEYFTIKNILIWCKNSGGLGDLKGSYGNNSEFIIFAVKGKHELNGKRGKAVLHFNKVTNKERVHQNQKPLKLIQYLIYKSSNKGDIVLDCFMGSGTTGVACKKMNRKFIGIELDTDYFKIAKRRMFKETINTKL